MSYWMPAGMALPAVPRDPLEETPTLGPPEESPVATALGPLEQQPDSYWSRTCYICGLSLVGFPEGSVIRRYYKCALEPDQKPHICMLSFCWDCHNILESRAR